MKHKAIVCVILSAVLLFTGTIAAFAYRNTSVEVQNHLAIGDVNISLEEFTKNGASYDSTERIVLPSEIISKSPRITNLAMPCYVRAKISLDQNEITSDKEVNCDIDASIWIRQGDYYYYTKPLAEGESVDFFRSLTIPAEWSEDESGKNFSLSITAEAVQASNFKPDFYSSDPWGGNKPEVCIHKSGESISKSRDYQNLTVQLDEDASKLLALPNDFFANFGVLMPGDLVSDVIQIQNQSKTATELFFSARSGKSDESLSEQIKLVIELDGKQLYTGSLRSESLQEGISLGNFDSGCDKSLKFTLSVPQELKNEYAMAQADETWIFSARFEELPSKAYGPATGDGHNILVWSFCAAGALLILVTIGIIGKKRRKDHEQI
ncbi:MAG: hypothetical protein PUJ62_11005 [Lachnospiraceae bacterium]|nr:hypothetical protein [Lachnospiraceae bacterium]